MADRTRGYAHRIDIAAGAARVWQALSDPAQLGAWCSPGAEIRPRPGGLFRASVDRLVELEAHIDVFEPERRLRLIYLPSEELPPADTALVDDILIEPRTPSITTVRVLGSGIPDTEEWDTQFMRLRTGWHRAIVRLKSFLEGKGERT